MSRKILLGIDLSTTDIGVVALEESSSEILAADEIKLPKYSFDYTTRKETIKRICSCLSSISWPIWDSYGKEIETDLFIEVSNFVSPKITQRFSRIAGMIEILVENYFNVVNVKHFNANEWRRLFVKDYFPEINNLINIRREEWKEKSINKLVEKEGKGFLRKDEVLTDNIADAYWIAFYGPKCLDVLQREHLTQKTSELTKMLRAFKKKPTQIKTNKINEMMSYIKNKKKEWENGKN